MAPDDKQTALISDVTATNDAGIEDLFDPGFYLDLVNRASTR